VKLPDVNLLVYAANESAAQHAPARAWVEETLSGRETVALAWPVLIGFVRVSTNPRVVQRPWSAEQAIAAVEGWLAQPPVTVVHPTDRHLAVMRDLLAPLGTAGNLTSDAHLAALAIEHGATLCSSDNDFSRFAGLRWVDPLQS
jgi:uncharacterized protein